MIRFFFNASYKGSHAGFQQSWISTAADQLAFLNKDVPMSPLTKSAMRNGGTRCAAGRYKNEVYFVLRGIETKDSDGRLWYVNLGMEAEWQEREQFGRIVRRILVEHKEFIKSLRLWFAPAEGALSYRINIKAFHEFIDSPSYKTMDESFYQKENYYVVVLNHFLKDLDKGATHRLNFLVPERSADYFYKMNPVFEKSNAAYSMPEKQFRLLLHRDPALYTYAEPLLPWKYFPVPDEDQLKKIRKAVQTGIAIMGTAAALDLTYRIVNAIFEEECK